MTSRRDGLKQAEPDAVWAVLADGWPAAGARLHHSVGAWPLLANDETEVVESVPGSLLVLRARVRPWGEATVRISVDPVGAASQVRIEEDVTSGPGSWVPSVVRRPALDWRNSETLRRLAHLSERRPSTARARAHA